MAKKNPEISIDFPERNPMYIFSKTVVEVKMLLVRMEAGICRNEFSGFKKGKFANDDRRRRNT